MKADYSLFWNTASFQQMSYIVRIARAEKNHTLSLGSGGNPMTEGKSECRIENRNFTYEAKHQEVSFETYLLPDREYSHMKLEAVLLDMERGQILGVFPAEEREQTERIWVDGRRKFYGSPANLALLVSGEWSDGEKPAGRLIVLADQCREKPLAGGVMYRHLYPKKEEGTVCFGTPRAVDAQSVSAPGEEENIRLMLYRYPPENALYDYVCGFGDTLPAGPYPDIYPYLGVPGKGAITLPKGARMGELNDNQGFSCFLYRKDGDMFVRYAVEKIHYIWRPDGFDYEIPVNWDIPFQEECGQNRIFEYLLKLHFSYYVSENRIEYCLVISSEEDGDYIIPKLRIVF